MVRILGTASALLLFSAAALSGRPLSGGDAPTGTPSARAAAWSFAQGNVVITASPNGRDVIVAFDANDGGSADGISDRVFLLQRSRELDAALPRLMSAITLDDASLRFDAGSLQVFHPRFSASLSVENKGYAVAAGEEELSRLATQPMLGEFQAVFTGYGLQRSTGAWAMSVDDLRAGAAAGFGCGTGKTAIDGSPLTGTPVTAFACASGGVGATQCSLDVGGGCSVSCGDGYYACCNLLGGCKCTALKVNVPG